VNKCRFCDIDKTKIYNTILEETNNFLVIPDLGSLVDGYVLVVSKKHLYNMNQLSNDIKKEYFGLIKKYRNIFFKIYGKYPIIFEHGTGINTDITSSSVIHAHTHIVNHNYSNEDELLNGLNFKEFDFINKNDFNNSYIMYISPNNKFYITYSFESISQLMRILIAKDLGLEKEYDWRKENFDNNYILTIEKISKFNGGETNEK